jgi:hypothetical protein
MRALPTLDYERTRLCDATNPPFYQEYVVTIPIPHPLSIEYNCDQVISATLHAGRSSDRDLIKIQPIICGAWMPAARRELMEL